ncbi:ATP binding cassette subfamily B19 [Wolffia australiana]
MTGGGDEAEKKKETSLPFYRLFSFADRLDWLLMAGGSLGAVIHGAAMPVFFLLFGNLINGFGKNQDDLRKMMEEVSKYALYFLYLGLVVCVSSYAEISCWMYTGERQVIALRKRFLEAVLQQDVGFFDTDARTGEIVFSVSTDTLLVQDAISEKVGNFIHYLSTFLAGLVVGFASAWRLALLSVAVIPGIAFAGGLYAYTHTNLSSKSRDSYANAGMIAEQAIAQIRTVYAFVGESKTLALYSEAIQNTLKLGYKAGMAKGLGIGCTYGIACMSWALVFWYAGVFIRNGQTDGGKAFTAIFSAIVGGMSLGQSFSNLGAFTKGKLAGLKLFEIIRQKPTIGRDPGEGKRLIDVNGTIEFRDVTFSYPSRPDVMVFRGLCLFIPAGKTVAVVGGSGSGKSTVVSLIERFYDPNQGQVLLDNVDLKTLQLAWLRDQIGLVNQEPALFATTILENILFGKPNATTAEVEAAATVANAHSFISLLPSGYHTQVGERGIQLSGGQKQRVAIARAVLKNPKILLLDEATSSLDSGSERSVQEALDRIMVGRTTVVVAHRLSTIRNVDTIAVVQNGQIVESGTHDDLIARGDGGAYSSLIRFQEMGRTKDLAFRRSRSSRLSHSLSAKSISLKSGSLRNLSYQYSAGADGRIEMVSNADKDRKFPAPENYFSRLLNLNGPEWPYALLGSIGSVLSGIIGPVFAIVMSNMIEVFYYKNPEAMEKKAREFVFVYVGTGLYAVVAYLMQHYFFSIMGENLTTRVRRMMLAAILRNEVGWFDEEENNSTLVAARLAVDAADVKSVTADRISVILQNMTSLLVSFIVGFAIEWRVALLILATFPLLVLANFAQQLSLKGFAGDTAKAHAKTSMIAGEAVSNMRTVAAFNAQEKISWAFAAELRRPRRRSRRRSQVAGALFGASQLLLYAAEGLILWYGAHLVLAGESSFAHVIKVFVVLVITANSVAETVSLAPEMARGGDSIRSVFQVLDRPTRIDPEEPGSDPGGEVVRGEIELRGVGLAYPARPEAPVLRGVSLRVRAGQSLGLVGPSGAGKSSVLALILRFYDPTAGRVAIDGRDIRRLNLRALRLSVGLVPQEPALFAGSVLENIAYGREGATAEEVEAAARAADAHGFISGMREGYGTRVGERGGELSGGQRQRIALARVVLKRPAVVLLDEASSALDGEAEAAVGAALEGFVRGRTCVVVAHRLAAVRGMDAIGVMQEGRLVEHGSHQELLSRPDGAYSRLLHLHHGGPHHPPSQSRTD